jgi:type III secretory pathway component EscS
VQLAAAAVVDVTVADVVGATVVVVDAAAAVADAAIAVAVELQAVVMVVDFDFGAEPFLNFTVSDSQSLAKSGKLRMRCRAVKEPATTHDQPQRISYLGTRRHQNRESRVLYRATDSK